MWPLAWMIPGTAPIAAVTAACSALTRSQVAATSMVSTTQPAGEQLVPRRHVVAPAEPVLQRLVAEQRCRRARGTPRAHASSSISSAAAIAAVPSPITSSSGAGCCTQVPKFRCASISS